MLELCVLNPDLGQGYYSGEVLEVRGNRYRHRPYKTWLDIAERLHCRLLTPLPEGEELVRLRFVPLAPGASWHTQEVAEEITEKYGTSSGFSRINKLEEPTFLLDYQESLSRVNLQPGGAVLDLGINTGDEFALFAKLHPAGIHTMTFTGIDHAHSALKLARERFPQPNFSFVHADINALATLELGVFDLVISIGTLQSPGINSHDVLRHLVKQRLTPSGSLVLGFPNCRYIDGEIVYGAKMKNFSRPDLSLLVKDLAFYRKYLQQHKFRVFITGKYYIFLTAIRS